MQVVAMTRWLPKLNDAVSFAIQFSRHVRTFIYTHPRKSAKSPTSYCVVRPIGDAHVTNDDEIIKVHKAHLEEITITQ